MLKYIGNKFNTKVTRNVVLSFAMTATTLYGYNVYSNSYLPETEWQGDVAVKASLLRTIKYKEDGVSFRYTQDDVKEFINNYKTASDGEIKDVTLKLYHSEQRLDEETEDQFRMRVVRMTEEVLTAGKYYYGSLFSKKKKEDFNDFAVNWVEGY